MYNDIGFLILFIYIALFAVMTFFFLRKTKFHLVLKILGIVLLLVLWFAGFIELANLLIHGL